jgi:predicted amidophosphoribosyltransferase
MLLDLFRPLEERVQNARTSFLLEDERKYSRVLLIDDAVSSGATINEMALKVKRNGVASFVAGYVVTGSYKGFDVIQEV